MPWHGSVITNVRINWTKMDTQPVEELGVEVETGNSPCLDPVPADTAEHDKESPGQPTESANLDATTMPKLTTEGGNKIAADNVTGDKDEPGETPRFQEEPPKLEPEVEVKEEASTIHSSENPAGANMEPVKDVVKPDLEPTPETKGATEPPKEEDKLEDGETPAKKPKVADQEEATTDPKKVFCEE